MSEENVEMVRGIIASINEGDLEAALETAHEDLEADWSNFDRSPTAGTSMVRAGESALESRGESRRGSSLSRGREQVRELFESSLDAWDEFRWDAEEVIEVDEARVLAVNRVRGRGRAAGSK
jgi:ketosteroid isomerase-like protein